MQRKILTLLFLAVLLCAFLLFASCSVKDREAGNLSELDDEELLQFLDEAGVSIPNGISASSIREVLAELEADPDRPPIIVDWTVLSDFYEDLREIVRNRQSSIQ